MFGVNTERRTLKYSGCILHFAKICRNGYLLPENCHDAVSDLFKLGEIAMDSELTTKISEVVFQLATAEKQRLEAAGTFVELEELATEIGDEVTAS